MIVDAHHHFWQVSRGDYHWMSPDLTVLNRDYLPNDLRPLLRRAGVDRTVLVQAAQTEAETEFLLRLAAETDFVAGVVGWLDFEDPDLPRKLDRLIARPKFVGLRPMLQEMKDDAYVLRPQVVANLRHLARIDLPFDFLTYPRHLPSVRRALEQVPDLRAVIDHLSKPPIASGQTRGWAEDISAIARNPRVFCKLSGMVTEADHLHWTPSDLEPFVRHILDVFGEDRIMFGSDWPVCTVAGTYSEVLSALRAAVAPFLGPAGTAKLLGANAMAFYNLREH